MLEKFKKTISKITEILSTTELSERTVEKYRDEIIFTLLQCDVALPVAEKLVDEIKEKARGVRVERFHDKRDAVKDILRRVLLEHFRSAGNLDLFKLADEKNNRGEPLVILFVGPNGHGKTTTIAKLAFLFKQRGYTVIIAASDTFRAGAIEQVVEHAKRVGVRVIKQKYGADPAAVAYDAVNHALSKGINVVLIDTAGRLQTDVDLMEEMKKIYRVASPDLVILVVDALTGNDAYDQAVKFNETTPLSGAIVTKFDADVKGGAIVSIVYATGKPILFIGTGQKYSDLKEFDPEEFVKLLGL
ncbi:MAG: signal recognition particle-docking protein FtsY [Thermoproteales archaeon]|nr:signal recognition particle-docking protein FtsY [Thermoproteales archaeon]